MKLFFSIGTSKVCNSTLPVSVCCNATDVNKIRLIRTAYGLLESDATIEIDDELPSHDFLLCQDMKIKSISTALQVFECEYRRLYPCCSMFRIHEKFTTSSIRILILAKNGTMEKSCCKVVCELQNNIIISFNYKIDIFKYVKIVASTINECVKKEGEVMYKKNNQSVSPFFVKNPLMEQTFDNLRRRIFISGFGLCEKR